MHASAITAFGLDMTLTFALCQPLTLKNVSAISTYIMNIFFSKFIESLRVSNEILRYAK